MRKLTRIVGGGNQFEESNGEEVSSQTEKAIRQCVRRIGR